MLHSEQPSADSNPSEVERKRVEESSEEREERMNLALDSAGVGTWNWKVALDAVTWDERMHRLFGLVPDTFPGTYDAFDVLLHPDDRERVKAEVTRTVNDDAPFDTQYRVIWPSDGSIHVISARGKVYRDEAGRAVRMTGVCSDITERRRIEDQLERERNLLRALMDNIPDNIYFKDLESRFVQINTALAKLFKLASPEEAIGRTDFDFFTAEHARAAYADEQEVIRSGEPMIGKVENESLPDDRTSWSLTTKMPLRDQHDQIVGTFGISRDITRLRRAAEALRESEQRYGRLLDSVTDYVYTVTLRDGQVLGTSHGPGCLAVTGYRPDEFQNDAWLWHRIIHPEDQDLVVENINRMLEEKAPRAIEHRIIRRDGAVRWVRNKQVAHCDDAGQLLSYDGLVSDITERKQAEAQVHEANAKLRTVLADLTKTHEDLKAAQMQLIQAEKLQSLGRLAAGVAHEVKNPLATLQMGLQCLVDFGVGGDAGLAPVLAQMQDAVTRAGFVIGELLNLSSPKELGMREVAINPLIEKALRFVRHEAAENKIKVIRKLAPDLPHCAVDPDKIEQVLINLVMNACDAMPEGGTLSVTSARKSLGAGDVAWEAGDREGVRFHAGEEVVVIELKDTGTGIPKSKLSHIFDPFYTSKPTGKGTGLGLSVARQIIELHKGRITVANRPNGGAIATILLKLRNLEK